jgi:hypothetical protein
MQLGLFQGIPVFIEGVTFDDPAVTGFSAGWMNKGEYNKNGEQEETVPFRGIVEFIQRNKNFDSDSFWQSRLLPAGPYHCLV